MNDLEILENTINIVDDDNEMEISIMSHITNNISVGDIIGIDHVNSKLWFVRDIDMSDADVQDFIENHFKHPIAVAIFIVASKNG